MRATRRTDLLVGVVVGVVVGVAILLIFAEELRCLSPAACEAANPKAALIR